MYWRNEHVDLYSKVIIAFLMIAWSASMSRGDVGLGAVAPVRVSLSCPWTFHISEIDVYSAKYNASLNNVAITSMILYCSNSSAPLAIINPLNESLYRNYRVSLLQTWSVSFVNPSLWESLTVKDVYGNQVTLGGYPPLFPVNTLSCSPGYAISTISISYYPGSPMNITSGPDMTCTPMPRNFTLLGNGAPYSMALGDPSSAAAPGSLFRVQSVRGELPSVAINNVPDRSFACLRSASDKGIYCASAGDIVPSLTSFSDPSVWTVVPNPMGIFNSGQSSSYYFVSICSIWEQSYRLPVNVSLGISPSANFNSTFLSTNPIFGYYASPWNAATCASTSAYVTKVYVVPSSYPHIRALAFDCSNQSSIALSASSYILNPTASNVYTFNCNDNFPVETAILSFGAYAAPINISINCVGTNTNTPPSGRNDKLLKCPVGSLPIGLQTFSSNANVDGVGFICRPVYFSCTLLIPAINVSLSNDTSKPMSYYTSLNGLLGAVEWNGDPIFAASTIDWDDNWWSWSPHISLSAISVTNGAQLKSLNSANPFSSNSAPFRWGNISDLILQFDNSTADPSSSTIAPPLVNVTVYIVSSFGQAFNFTFGVNVVNYMSTGRENFTALNGGPDQVGFSWSQFIANNKVAVISTAVAVLVVLPLFVYFTFRCYKRRMGRRRIMINVKANEKLNQSSLYSSSTAIRQQQNPLGSTNSNSLINLPKKAQVEASSSKGKLDNIFQSMKSLGRKGRVAFTNGTGSQPSTPPTPNLIMNVVSPTSLHHYNSEMGQTENSLQNEDSKNNSEIPPDPSDFTLFSSLKPPPPMATNRYSEQMDTYTMSTSFQMTFQPSFNNTGPLLALPGYWQIDIKKDLKVVDDEQFGKGGTASVFKAKIINPEVLSRCKEMQSKKGISAPLYGTDIVAVKMLSNTTTDDMFRLEVALMSSIPPSKFIVLFLGYSENPSKAIIMKCYTYSIKDFILHFRKVFKSIGPETRSEEYAFELERFYQLVSNVAWQTASGLVHLHRNKIVHFDIKPMNILVDLEDSSGSPTSNLHQLFRGAKIRCVITDFGFAKPVGSDLKPMQDRVVRGLALPEKMGLTISYSSPEVHHDCQEIHKMVDVYAFAVTLFELSYLTVAWSKVPNPAIITNVKNGMRPTVNVNDMNNVPGLLPILSTTEKCDPIFQKAKQNWDLLKGIMTQGWAQSPGDRPNMETILKLLSPYSLDD